MLSRTLPPAASLRSCAPRPCIAPSTSAQACLMLPSIATTHSPSPSTPTLLPLFVVTRISSCTDSWRACLVQALMSSLPWIVTRLPRWPSGAICTWPLGCFKDM
ncbi:hypothetical protein RSAG8_05778, partial [Rhizoctonia solani AG-8 WAC10335]